MSETGNNKQKKFPEFDCLSTEELIELLRRDSYSDPYDTTKVDAILHISGVIEERTRKEKAENAYNKINPEIQKEKMLYIFVFNISNKIEE